MKFNVSKAYLKRLRKVLKIKLNGGNLVRRVNTWAVFLLRYSTAFVGGKVNCRLLIAKLGSCLLYIEH